MDNLQFNAVKMLAGESQRQRIAESVLTGRQLDGKRRGLCFAQLTARLLVAALLLFGVLMIGPSRAFAADSIQEGSDKCTGVEVTLKFPRSETIARALEVTRALQASGDVLRVRYGVADGEAASAEIVHCPETPAETIKRIVETLTSAAIEDVKVKQYEPSCD